VALAWSGERLAGMDTPAECPSGQVGYGHMANVGSFVDRYQLVCGTLSLEP
jgi:hypothetical protein